jgi:CheY-like chemotaxis protein
MHGGKVEAFSAGHGQGSEFVVHLPTLREKLYTTEVKTATASKSPRSASLRILVVDDNLDSADTLALLLQSSGHNVRIANEADTALETADTFKPQVIVLDIGLPKMDGYQVAQRLRQQPQLENPFLIALTGYGQDEDRQRSKQAGFNYHFVKPVDPQGLQSLISSLAGRYLPMNPQA